MTRRLFLVAGSAGSGKSTLAKALAHELDAGWLQLDSIWLAMKVAAGEGTPAQDILDIDRRMRREDEADNDVLAAHVAASGEVCRALPTVLELELEAHKRLVVDGAWLLPSFVTEIGYPTPRCVRSTLSSAPRLTSRRHSSRVGKGSRSRTATG